MLAVITYIGLFVLGLLVAVYRLENNNWHRVVVVSNNPVFATLFSWVFAGLIWWWIVASVGWCPATVVMVVWGGINVLWGLLEEIFVGGTVTSVPGTVLGALFGIGMSIALLSSLN